ncbi:unnamed protein product [Rotaria sp. Silwood2]|nr:unnamed protein product [Rotaria sp. Silwood2]CAF3040313.1 unnamed protein product [Rotaria sp. Silwood2]CAF3356958.1 unnamed protein product [Rotaria sp. Silwood2]CAF3458558.1 unnamed protein product [Rotaria sp. Silwood2]CAF4477440.1 unnamed protein product [Rotaria sp. Silwood2]
MTTRSLFMSDISLNMKEKTLLHDLGHNYVGVEKVSRIHDDSGKPTDAIRVDMKSNKLAMKILDDGYILFDGKKCDVRPYWPRLCRRCRKEGHNASECPQRPLTFECAMEIFKEQQTQLEAKINAFESKWNTRLSSLITPSMNVNIDQVLPIFKDLKTVAQQLNQQNVQVQRQLRSIVNRVQDVKVQLSNAQEQKT